MKPHVVWIGIVVLLLLGAVVTQGVLIFAALTDPSFAVVPDYGRKANEWDAEQLRLEASRRLEWTVELSTRPGAKAGEVDVRLELFDRNGTPIRDATVLIEGFHNARASRILRSNLPHDQDGAYASTLPIRRSGLWEFRLDVSRGDELYTDIVRKDVLSTPRTRGR